MNRISLWRASRSNPVFAAMIGAGKAGLPRRLRILAMTMTELLSSTLDLVLVNLKQAKFIGVNHVIRK